MYYIYNSAGKFVEVERPPDTGYYYVREREGIDDFDITDDFKYTLWQANPSGDDKILKEWGSGDDRDFIVTEDGYKYKTKKNSYGNTVADPDAGRERYSHRMPDKVDPDNSSSSLTSPNGTYRLKLDDQGNLILTRNGDPVWGYSGADAQNLLKYLESPDNKIALRDDGAIVEVDKDGQIVKVIREAGDETHPILIVLYHPKYGTPVLHHAISETQDALQLQVDCFGKGKPELAKDVSEYLTHNDRLADRRNQSKFTDRYNNDYLDPNTDIKMKYKQADTAIAGIAIDTSTTNSAAFKKIVDTYHELNDKLRAVDNESSRYTEKVWDSPGEVTKLSKDGEIALLNAMQETLRAADRVLEQAIADNRELADRTDRKKPDARERARRRTQAAVRHRGGGRDFAGDSAGPVSRQTGSPLISGPGAGPFPLGEDPAQAANPARKMPEPDIDRLLDASNRPSLPAAPNSAPDASAMVPMMLLPILQQMMQQRQQKDTAARQEREPVPPEPAWDRPAPGPAQAASVPASHNDSPITAPAATEHGRQATAPGMVDVELPNGATQKAPAIVAEAIRREIGNTEGSDAHAAYAGTPAAHSWVPIDAAEAHTGDIVQWKNRSALVVGFGDELYFLSNGKMVAADVDSPPDDGHGAHGPFQGFFRPPGTAAPVPAASAG